MERLPSDVLCLIFSKAGEFDSKLSFLLICKTLTDVLLRKLWKPWKGHVVPNGMHYACANGFLLYYKRFERIAGEEFDPSSCSNLCLRLAASAGHYDMVQHLLKDKRVDPSDVEDMALIGACKQGYVKVVELLLCDSRVNAGARNNLPLRVAAMNGRTDVVKLLLDQGGVNAAASNNEAVTEACLRGYLDIVIMLHKSSDEVTFQSGLLSDVAGKGHVNIFNYLMDFCDVSENENLPIRMASASGKKEIVKILLTLPSVDATAGKNYAIKMAAKHNHAEVVQMLLDGGVDPSVDDNAAFRQAYRYGCEEVQAVLLKDDRVLQSLSKIYEKNPFSFP